MGRSTQVVTSFTAGEWSPRASMRVDLQDYPKSLQFLENFIVSPQGGCLFRAGTHLIQEALGHDKDYSPRLIPIRRGGDLGDLVMMIENQASTVTTVTLWNSQGLTDVYTGSPAGVFGEENLDNIEYTQRNKLLVLTNAIQPPQFVKFDNNWDVADFRPIERAKIPIRNFRDEKSPPVVNDQFTVTFSGMSFTNGTLLQGRINGALITSTGFTTVTLTYPYKDSTEVVRQNIKNLFTSGDIDFDVSDVEVALQSGGEADGVYTVTLSGDAAGSDILVEIHSDAGGGSVVTDATSSGSSQDEPAWSYPQVVTHNGSYYQVKAPHVSGNAANPDPVYGDNEPGVGADWTTYWETGSATPPAWEAWQPSEPWVPPSPPVSGKAYGMWDRGFPETCVFYDQRLVFGATKDLPSTFWGSTINSFENFTLGVNDNQAFAFDLESPSNPAIRWMTSQRGLAIGTSDGTWLVNADVTITPTNVQASRFTGRRAFSERAAVVGNEIFYIDQARLKLRRNFYARTSAGYQDEDATVFAEHLGRKRMKRIAVSMMPETVIYVSADDLDLIALSYDRFTNVSAYSRQTFPDGEVGDIVSAYDASAGSFGQSDLLFMPVKRGTEWNLEVLPYPAVGDEEDDVYAETIHLDSWTSYQFNGFDNQTLNDRLPGDQVSVLAQTQDPAGGEPIGYTYIGDYTLSEFDGNRLTVDQPVWGVQVGYRYTGTIQTQEVVTNPDEGVGFTSERQFSRLFARLYKSSMPLINGERPEERGDDPMDNPIQLYSGDVVVTDNLPNKGIVTITQDLPYPCQVVGIFGDVDVNNA